MQGWSNFLKQRSTTTQQTPLAPSLLIHFDIASESVSNRPLCPGRSGRTTRAFIIRWVPALSVDQVTLCAGFCLEADEL